MAAYQGGANSLGQLLAARRRDRFVGRVAEVELFRSALEGGADAFSVLFLHGPGGIGKTSLLDIIADVAVAAGTSVVRLDGRELVISPAAVIEGLAGALEHGDDGSMRPRSGRVVVLVDHYERLEGLDDWVRMGLLPRLPADTLVVLAGRQPPAPAWRADAGWRDLLRVVSLRNLDPDESRQYLDASGVDGALHGRLIAMTHGHPLGLSLVADVVARGGQVSGDALAPDLVGELLRSFVDAVPDDRQQAALRVCSLARVTTEALLRDVGIADAGEVFGWLHGLSFIEAVPDGVLPHDLARDVLDADLRWRDPEGYVRVFRHVADHVHRRLRSLDGREQVRAISDLKFLFRNLPSVLTPVDWDAWGQHHPEPARQDDREAIVALVERWEGRESARLADHWLALQPAGFVVVRGEGEVVRGVVGSLDLTAATEEQRAVDPAACAVWRHANDAAPPRSGEVVGLTRFVVDRDTYQGPSPTLNAVPVITLQRQLATPNLAWDHLLLHDPDDLDEFFALADLPRVPQADVEVGGRRYGVFAHDYRRVPVDALVRLWTERALAQDPTLRPAPTSAVQVLSQREFTEAVRQALRDLTRPDLLARNPLLRTRLVRDGPSDRPGHEVLETVLREAVTTLAQHPRDDKLLRAVERTYVDPAPTQEAAAARLGLPFSTFRRHLTQGLERIVAWLWDREVYGPDGP